MTKQMGHYDVKITQRGRKNGTTRTEENRYY